QGNFSQIRPCVGCCLGCIHAVLAKEPGSCVVNPDVGREYKLKEAQEAMVPLKILVVGAGPAGMAAARMFALHGHKTLVCEKESVLGGLLALAAIAPGRGELGDILKFFRKEMDRLKVEIRYDTPLTAALLDEIRPDKVILATGSLPDMPVIKGLFQTKMTVITNVDLLRKKEKPGNKVVVLGGGMTGLIVADFLADQGKQVVVLNRKKSFAEEMSSNDRYYLRERLKEGKVALYKNVAIQAFTDDGVLFKSNGEPHTLTGFDTVVISEKQQSIRDAKQLGKNTAAKFYFIGDARSPRHLMYCISEAEEIARSV
ncbi:MAG: FAD-dependent oxidoreductase, partial [Proteobacteria bacterium]|nr:FAD-dependent oxidoreductase [Pseudomonadota bacterium]